MSEDALDIASLQQACEDQFGVSVTVQAVIARFPTSPTALAMLFTVKSGHLLLYIHSRGMQVFGDVQKMVLRMECEADTYYPPHAEADYFDRIARDKFRLLFPGKHIIGEDDLRYYKALAPYNPALVRITKVKGEVRGYDEHLKAWRKVKDFHYSKITAV